MMINKKVLEKDHYTKAWATLDRPTRTIWTTCTGHILTTIRPYISQVMLDGNTQMLLSNNTVGTKMILSKRNYKIVSIKIVHSESEMVSHSDFSIGGLRSERLSLKRYLLKVAVRN